MSTETIDAILRDRARRRLCDEIHNALSEFERRWHNPVAAVLEIGGQTYSVPWLLRMIGEATINQHTDFYARKEVKLFMDKVDQLGGV